MPDITSAALAFRQCCSSRPGPSTFVRSASSRWLRSARHPGQVQHVGEVVGELGEVAGAEVDAPGRDPEPLERLASPTRSRWYSSRVRARRSAKRATPQTSLSLREEFGQRVGDDARHAGDEDLLARDHDAAHAFDSARDAEALDVEREPPPQPSVVSPNSSAVYSWTPCAVLGWSSIQACDASGGPIAESRSPKWLADRARRCRPGRSSGRA